MAAGSSCDQPGRRNRDEEDRNGERLRRIYFAKEGRRDQYQIAGDVSGEDMPSVMKPMRSTMPAITLSNVTSRISHPDSRRGSLGASSVPEREGMVQPPVPSKRYLQAALKEDGIALYSKAIEHAIPRHKFEAEVI